jgi:O-antigen/teichoic acid export membrane protein
LVLAGPIPVGLGRSHLAGNDERLLSAAVRHALVALGGSACLTAVGLAVGIDRSPILACILLAVPAGVLVYDVLVLLQAAKRPWAYHAIRIAQAGVVTCGLCAITIARPDSALDWALAFFAIGTLASAGIAGLVARRWNSAGSIPTLRALARTGRGSTGANVIDFLSLRADQFVVIAFTGPVGLGVYSVAVNWSEVGLYVGHSIGQASFESRDTLDDWAVSNILRRSTQILSGLVLLLAVTGWFLITPLFGSSFADARWVLLLLTPGIVARGTGYTSGQILLARGEGQFVTRTLAVTGLAGLSASVVLTIALGIGGAAIASSAVYALQMVVLRQKTRVRS